MLAQAKNDFPVCIVHPDMRNTEASCTYSFDHSDYANKQCPHGVMEGQKYCIFHAPVDDKIDEDVKDELLQKVCRSDGKSNEFIEAKFGDLDLTCAQIESDDNSPVNLEASHIKGDLTIKSGIVDNPLLLSRIQVDGKTTFQGTDFNQVVESYNSHYKGGFFSKC